MGHRRSRANQFLPPNVYLSGPNGYYRYRHPRTGRYKSLGRDKKRAMSVAAILNSRFYDLPTDDEALADFIEHSADRKSKQLVGKTVSDLINEYIERRVPEKRWADQTRKNELACLDRQKRELGQRLLSQCTTLFISNWLDGLSSRAAYTKNRTRLSDVFAYGVARGYCNDNPVVHTIARVWSRKDKKRKRLSLEAFQQIHAIAPPWYQIALEMALITLQRRSDLIQMRYTDIHDDGSSKPRLRIAQQKTHRDSDAAFIAIALSAPLRAVIDRSRDGVDSQFIIHRKPKKRILQRRGRHTQATLDEMTGIFSSLRDELCLYSDLEVREKPSFHEIRALGIHLYEKRLGVSQDYTQRLAGHSKRKMTEEYALGHEIDYEPVEADMDVVDLLNEVGQPKLI